MQTRMKYAGKSFLHSPYDFPSGRRCERAHHTTRSNLGGFSLAQAGFLLWNMLRGGRQSNGDLSMEGRTGNGTSVSAVGGTAGPDRRGLAVREHCFELDTAYMGRMEWELSDEVDWRWRTQTLSR